MKLYIFKPYPESLITQRFGDNANPLYAGEGLKGHTAFDYGVAYGTPIPNCIENSFVYSFLNKENPDLTRYRAVCTMWDDPDTLYSFELIYGHCSAIQGVLGSRPKVNEQLASVGNTGDVYSGNHYVTGAEKAAGSTAGAHLHFQLRQCLRTKTLRNDRQYILDGNGMLQRNGYFYEVVNYENGYNGCISPQPFFHDILAQNYVKDIGILQSLVKQLSDYITSKLTTKTN